MLYWIKYQKWLELRMDEFKLINHKTIYFNSKKMRIINNF